MKMPSAAFAVLGILLPAPGPLSAQAPAGKDPMKKIQELFKKAEKAMDKIDDALLGADPVRAGDPAKVKTSLQEAYKNQEVVKKTIEEILKNLPPSPNGGGGGGSCNKPSSQPKNQPKPQNRPRQREKKPDIVKNRKKPSGQKPKPKGGKKPKSRGNPKPRNARKTKGKRPPKNPAGKKQPQGGSETWGNLPLFLRDVFREEQAPRLPAKYLPFWKAFLKRGREKK